MTLHEEAKRLFAHINAHSTCNQHHDVIFNEEEILAEIEMSLQKVRDDTLEEAASITQDTIWTTTADSIATYHRYQSAIRTLKGETR